MRRASRAGPWMWSRSQWWLKEDVGVKCWRIRRTARERRGRAVALLRITYTDLAGGINHARDAPLRLRRLSRRGRADAGARRGVRELFERRRALDEANAAAAPGAGLSRDVRESGIFGAAMLRDDGPVIIGESDAARQPRRSPPISPRLAGAPGRGGRAGRLRCVRAANGTSSPGRACRLRVRLRQHVLTTVNAVPGARGAARMATAADADWLVLRQIAFIEEVGIPDPPGTAAREIMPPRIARGDFRIWDDGRPRRLRGLQRRRAGIRAHRARLHAARLPWARVRDVARRCAVARAHGAREAQALPDDRRRRIRRPTRSMRASASARKTTIAGSISSRRAPSANRP